MVYVTFDELVSDTSRDKGAMNSTEEIGTIKFILVSMGEMGVNLILVPKLLKLRI